MTLPKETRYQSVRWINSGKSTIANEAKRHKVSQQAVKNWITRYKKEKLSGGVPNRSYQTSPKESATLSANVDSPTGNDAPTDGNAFARALESAGSSDGPIEDSASGTDDKPVDGGSDTVADPPPTAPPEIKPEDLVAFSEMIVVQIPKTYGMLRRIAVPDSQLRFTDDERKSLMMTAPYACQYAPAILAKAPAAMACVFLGTLVMMSVSRLGLVKRAVYERDKLKREIVEAEQEVPPESVAPVPELVVKKHDAMGFPIQ